MKLLYRTERVPGSGTVAIHTEKVGKITEFDTVWKVVTLGTTTRLMHGGTFNGHSCVNLLLYVRR